MISNFANGLGAVFVINLLWWLVALGIGFTVFGALYGFVLAIRLLFNFQ
jgi:hypothetical protein